MYVLVSRTSLFIRQAKGRMASLVVEPNRHLGCLVPAGKSCCPDGGREKPWRGQIEVRNRAWRNVPGAKSKGAKALLVFNLWPAESTTTACSHYILASHDHERRSNAEY